jgi:two-component system sensor histidine kinase CpxA
MRISKLYLKFFLSFIVIFLITGILIFALFHMVAQKTMFDEFYQLVEANKFVITELLEDRIKAHPAQNLEDNVSIRDVLKKLSQLYEAKLWITDSKGKTLVLTFEGETPNTTPPNLKRFRCFAHIRSGIDEGKPYMGMPLNLAGNEPGMLHVVLHGSRHKLAEGPFALGLVAIGLIVALLILPIYRFISEPLGELRHAAQGIARGDLTCRASVKSTDEIGELAGAFNHMAETIERMVKTTKELTANVSHELRSPLARIRIAQELLLEKLHDPAQEKKYLESIQEEIEEMDHLIGQILTLSKLDMQQGQGISEDFDMQALANDLLDRFAPSIAHKRIRLAAELPHAALPIHARREEIRTALANLLDNAVKFTPEDGEISLAVAKAPGVVKVIVMNTCEPIGEEDLKKIFEPFFRIQGEAGRGTGLGLAITLKIVERHQGSLNATYREGKLIVEMFLSEKIS